MSDLAPSVSTPCVTARSAGGAKFPVFPAETGILSIFRVQPPFGRENGEANQALAGGFP